ncbi:Acetyltransferase (GNAT) domain-containing protein [Streptomyces atratus]|uniref:Acetyltransferase (GNAT) domain-containing protein n=2 Tax=Streptomyces atratus TaxID=1893 RepID=A0A1K2FDD5_STRAR|nr:Acetyltransferase (GNAT) domain-containing protein [Streptomyces atratus]
MRCTHSLTRTRPRTDVPLLLLPGASRLVSSAVASRVGLKQWQTCSGFLRRDLAISISRLAHRYQFVCRSGRTLMKVTLQVDSTPSASALFLRPWNDGDVEPLVEAYRDPTLRRWTGLSVESIEEAVEWLELQRRGWATGKRLSFAVHEDRSGTGEGRLAGNVVMKRTSSSQESAEVGYWTAVHARGRGWPLVPSKLSPAGPSTSSRSKVWNVSTCSIRWTTSPRAGLRRRPDTGFTRSFRLGRLSSGTATCIYDEPTLRPDAGEKLPAKALSTAR